MFYRISLASVLALAASTNAFAVPVAGEILRERYGVTSASQKLIGENGSGRAELYGTRNFRAVLNGVLFRGGGNNTYLKPPRNGKNPLPNVGLENLCKEGFTRAIYNYSTNFASAPKEIRCKDFQGNDNVLTYLQISPLAYRETELRAMLTMIHEHIRDPRRGAIYDHCWNGWHASGYVSATTLRQFCDYTAAQAVAYWNLHTDNNSGSSYEPLRKKIREFVPYKDLTITAEEKIKLCPTAGNYSFLKVTAQPR